MHLILLSGGSGKRLWPLSNDVRSKQFLKLFRTEDGEYCSMVQRIYAQIKTADPDADITIATSRSQISAIHNQLGDAVSVCAEPCRRDTFPAIALASAYLHEKMGVSENEAVAVCPVDPFVDPSYFTCVKKIWEKAQTGDRNLVLMGIEPTYPSAKYGYIRPVKQADTVSYAYTEKPTEEKAAEYIAEGALWNGGVFAFKLSYLLEKCREILGKDSYDDLRASYADLKKISFDYAVAEHEPSIAVLKYSGTWKDLGTWNTLTEAMAEPVIGKGRMSDSCDNTHIVNELDIPVLCMGTKDLVICASPEGILVSDKHQSSYIKPYVDELEQPVMIAEKSWGEYRVLEIAEDAYTIKVTLNPGHKMNYHSHERREEVWTVIAGSGTVVLDGIQQDARPGDVFRMPIGCKHTVIAGESGVQLIEVQLGSEISVTDKIKYEI